MTKQFVFLQSAEFESGKTSMAAFVAAHYRGQGQSVAGILTHKVYEGHARMNFAPTGYEAQRLATGESRLIAHKRIPGDLTIHASSNAERVEDDRDVYHGYEAAIAEVVGWAQNDLASSPDVFIFDAVGGITGALDTRNAGPIQDLIDAVLMKPAPRTLWLHDFEGSRIDAAVQARRQIRSSKPRDTTIHSFTMQRGMDYRAYGATVIAMLDGVDRSGQVSPDYWEAFTEPEAEQAA